MRHAGVGLAGIVLAMIVAGWGTAPLGAAAQEAPEVSIPITVSDDAGGTQELTFGIDPEATDGNDQMFGEEREPPFPPSPSSLVARWIDEDLNEGDGLSGFPDTGMEVDIRAGGGSFVGTKTHEIRFETGESASEITFSWDLPDGVTGRIQDQTALGRGNELDQEMSGSGSATLTNLNVTKAVVTLQYELNDPPAASFTFAPGVPTVGEAVTFDAGGSSDADGSIAEYRWDFDDDGTTDATGEGVEHSFASAGEQAVTLTVADDAGATETVSATARVTQSRDPSLRESMAAWVGSDGLRDFGPTGTNIDFSGIVGSATVTVNLFGKAPSETAGIPESNVSKYRIVINAGEGLSVGQSTEVRFEVGTLGGIGDPTRVQIYRRSIPGSGKFDRLDTKVDSMGTPEDPSDDEIVATVSGFSEFVLASDSEPLPVELSGFDASVDGRDAARLTWTTASETNNAGFEVQRKAADEPETAWTEINFVESKAPGGTTEKPQRYRFTDEDLPFAADGLEYRLRQVDLDGTAELTDAVSIERTVEEIELRKTFPNPARSQATVRFAVPERQEVTLHLYDVLGREVRTVQQGETEGRRELQVDLSGLASGVYFLRLRAGGQTRTQKITIVQ